MLFQYPQGYAIGFLLSQLKWKVGVYKMIVHKCIAKIRKDMVDEFS